MLCVELISVCALSRYLQSEWEVRRGSSREFGLDQMKSSHCQVPLQDNSSDCGLYLLQYVECFLKVQSLSLWPLNLLDNLICFEKNMSCFLFCFFKASS